MTNIQMGKKNLQIITFEKENVSPQRDANKFTHHVRLVSLSPFVWLKTKAAFKAFRGFLSSWWWFSLHTRHWERGGSCGLT